MISQPEIHRSDFFSTEKLMLFVGKKTNGIISTRKKRWLANLSQEITNID